MHNFSDKETMPTGRQDNPFSPKKRLKSFEYAFHGIRSFFLSTPNAWIHLVITALVIGASFYFHLSLIEWIAVIYCIGLVFTAEALNTAVEEWVDSMEPNFNEKAGRVKDIAAGAVLIAAIVAAIIGILIFGTRIYDLMVH